MKKAILAALTFLSVMIVCTVSGQTADEVINKYMDAVGGADKLRSIRSLYMQGVSVMPNGNEVTSKTYQVQGKLYRREIEFGMGSVVIIITDKEGWASNPRSGGKFEPLPAEVVKDQQFQLDCAGPLVDYAAKGHKAELAGKETIDSLECYKIKLTLNTGKDINYFIDTKNYYIVRESFKGNGMFGGNRPGGRQPDGDNEIKITFSDYRKTPGGYVFPYTVSMGMGASLHYETIEVNKPVDEKLYRPNH